MKIIAHRGLLRGPNTSLENKPSEILSCLEQGYDVEVDVRYIDDQWWLGHDAPTYPTSLEFLSMDNLWIHAKDIASATQLLQHTKRGYNLNFFWHDKDDRTLTSHGFWWTDPAKELTELSVWVMPESKWGVSSLWIVKNTNCYAICTDYAEHVKEILDVA